MTFSDLSIYFKKLEETASRNTMTEILAELFKKTTPLEIGKICYLLLGRVAPLYEAIEFGLADKFVMRAISQAYEKDKKEVVAAFKKYGDLGVTAEKCSRVLEHENRRHHAVVFVYDTFYELAKESGQGSQEKKITILATLLSSFDALSARYIARIPLDKLRLGFSDMTILDALSWMLVGDKSARSRLEEVYNIRPDIGLLAQIVKEHGIEGLAKVKATVGAPILASLCQRLPSADEMIKKMGTVAVEPKWDGVRVQIHYKKMSNVKCQMSNVKTFSRNLENTTQMFPELQHIGKQLNGQEVILDSEAVGVDPATGTLIPFQETMTRKRKHGIAQQSLSVPLKFFVFDILYKDGKELLTTPLSERRNILESTIHQGDRGDKGDVGGMLVISPQIVTGSPAVIREYHDEQINKGLEGAVVKKWNSPYEPGRRGYSWVKFKEEEGKFGKLSDTIDAIVMGYSSGQGKRTAFGIGQMLLGVKDGEEYVTITKLGSGATDLELGTFFQMLKKIRVKIKPKEYKNIHKIYTPDYWVLPQVVLEIAGDNLTKSPTHGAGIAIRFPRLVRIRDDKFPEQATTVAELKIMYEQQ